VGYVGLSKYSIESVSNFHEWDRFVDSSPQGTIFSYSYYLQAAVDNWGIYWVKKGQQIKAGFSVVLNDSRDSTILDDLVVYNGLMFAPSNGQNKARVKLENFSVTEFVIEWMGATFKSINMALSPQVGDMRPYLWHNYHSQRQTDHFSLDLRYTSYIDIDSLRCGPERETSLFKGLEPLRRRNIAEARKDKAKTTTKGAPALFVKNFKLMMSEKGEPQSDDKMNRLERLIRELVKNKQAEIFITQKSCGDLIYISVFGWDSKRAYYLFGTPVVGSTSRYKGTISFWDAFIYLSKMGISNVDLEGVNSPNRGRFKLSFGGDLLNYYEVSK